MTAKNIPCNFFRNDSCKLIQKLSGIATLDCSVSAADCSKCTSTHPSRMVNRVTLALTLNRLRHQSKFSIVHHYDLVNAIQCSIGTGTQLHKYLKWFRSADCGCEHRINVMNVWGPSECVKQKDTIMKWLEEASFLVRIEFVHRIIEGFLDDSIEASFKLHEEHELEWIYNV